MEGVFGERLSSFWRATTRLGVPDKKKKNKLLLKTKRRKGEIGGLVL